MIGIRYATSVLLLEGGTHTHPILTSLTNILAQILVTDNPGNFEWVPGNNGSVPSGAIQGGVSPGGEALFIGRTLHEGTLTPGKVQPSLNCLYIPYCWKEHRYYSYEVLVCKSMVL